jgi:hypothetical protein
MRGGGDRRGLGAVTHQHEGDDGGCQVGARREGDGGGGCKWECGADRWEVELGFYLG